VRAITVHLPFEELAFVDRCAAGETRQRSQQIRHFIREAMRSVRLPPSAVATPVHQTEPAAINSLEVA
jgi:hypothetical protein